MNLKYLRLGILGLSLGLGVLAAFTYYFKVTPKSYASAETTKSLPNLGGPFKLNDQFGKIRTNDEFKGKFMLLYFGYTFCPDVCPLGLQNIGEALRLLGRDIDQVVPLFITIDPERDTVENLKIYATNWHSSFVFLTGTHPELDPVLKAYKVYAAKAKPDGTMADYLMDHSALVYLVDRNGKFVDYFPHTTNPAQMAKLIQKQLILSPSK
ncbi:SCO family protein [Candidatus Paracaedibacter symbiosus]|uniref:SCO family protein n=1 Tax=Candidatus Paracaedibacter symbiosus TaxID=244582 RepID=UPI0005094EA9|nr:SCO family protein [Candidatus Paracaedibacter symbiosus]